MSRALNTITSNQVYREISETDLPITITGNGDRHYEIYSLRPLKITGYTVSINGTTHAKFYCDVNQPLRVEFAPATGSPSGERKILILEYSKNYTPGVWLNHSYVLAVATWSSGATNVKIAGWAPAGISPYPVYSCFINEVSCYRMTTANLDTGAFVAKSVRRCTLADGSETTIHSLLNETPTTNGVFYWRARNKHERLFWPMDGIVIFTGEDIASDTYVYANIHIQTM